MPGGTLQAARSRSDSVTQQRGSACSLRTARRAGGPRCQAARIRAAGPAGAGRDASRRVGGQAGRPRRIRRQCDAPRPGSGPGVGGGGYCPGSGLMRPPLRLLVADDQAVVRMGFTAMLESQPDMRVVATAHDGQQAVRMAREFLADVVLMDIRMPVLDGIEATRQLSRGENPPSVLVLTTFALDD